MDLTSLRNEIDEIDEKLLELLERRMEIVLQVAEYKREKGLPVLNEEREAQVIARARQRAGAELADTAEAFFTHLMGLSRERQQDYLGGAEPEKGPLVRKAATADIGDISRVLAASWKTAYRGIVDDGYLDALTEDYWVPFLSAGLKDGSVFSLVMEQDGKLVGASILSRSKRERTAQLISFYLLPHLIGKGLGHQFYREIEAYLRDSGFRRVELDVLIDNKRAIRFYERHGFEHTRKVVTTALGPRDYHCLIMEKELTLP